MALESVAAAGAGGVAVGLTGADAEVNEGVGAGGVVTGIAGGATGVVGASVRAGDSAGGFAAELSPGVHPASQIALP